MPGRSVKDLPTAPPPSYGRKVDVWALGISAYTIYAGDIVPNNKCITNFFYQVIRDDLRREIENDEDVVDAPFI